MHTCMYVDNSHWHLQLGPCFWVPGLHGITKWTRSTLNSWSFPLTWLLPLYPHAQATPKSWRYYFLTVLLSALLAIQALPWRLRQPPAWLPDPHLLLSPVKWNIQIWLCLCPCWKPCSTSCCFEDQFQNPQAVLEGLARRAQSTFSANSGFPSARPLELLETGSSSPRDSSFTWLWFHLEDFPVLAPVRSPASPL